MSDQDITEPSAKKAVRRGAPSEGLRPFAFFRCLTVRGGHDYVNSKSKPGYLTCVRCRHRRSNRM